MQRWQEEENLLPGSDQVQAWVLFILSSNKNTLSRLCIKTYNNVRVVLSDQECES